VLEKPRKKKENSGGGLPPNSEEKNLEKKEVKGANKIRETERWGLTEEKKKFRRGERWGKSRVFGGPSKKVLEKIKRLGARQGEEKNEPPP